MIASAWRRNLWLWLPAAVFFLLTVVLLGVFALEFADETQVARTRLARRTEELDVIRAQRERAQGIVEKVRASEEGLADFYGRRLSTEREGLTRILAEIKNLCRLSGIPPTSLAYERQALEGQDVSRRTITFSVDGSYAQLRQLINFIELSDSFLILDEVSLRGNDVEGTPLRISLKLSTLFTVNSGAPAREPPNLES